jgi:dodecin
MAAAVEENRPDPQPVHFAPRRSKEVIMADKVYKKIEIVGTSTQGYEQAIQNAIEQARRTLKGLSWFEVVEHRGNLTGTEVMFQVTLKVGFQIIEE